MTAEVLEALSHDERDELEACIDVINRGLTVWYEVAEALHKIRDQRLYRETHTSFEAFCRDKWGMSKTHANRLIAGSKVVDNLTPIGVNGDDSADFPLPQTESQARALAAIPRPLQPIVWRLSVMSAEGEQPPASLIKSTGNIVQIAAHTGSIEDGEGNDIPLSSAMLEHYDAAITEDAYERLQRQKEHIREKSRPLPQAVYEGFATMEDDGLVFDVTLNLEPGKRYKVKIYEVV